MTEFTKVQGAITFCAKPLKPVTIPDPKKERADRVKIDKRISGRYIVAAVKHTILNRSELRTNITLSRDSFGGTRLPDIEVSGGQVNLDGTN